MTKCLRTKSTINNGKKIQTYKLMVVKNNLLFQLFFLILQSSCLDLRLLIACIINVLLNVTLYKLVLIITILFLLLVVLFLALRIVLVLTFTFSIFRCIAFLPCILVFVISCHHFTLLIVVVKDAVVTMANVIVNVKILVLHNCN